MSLRNNKKLIEIKILELLENIKWGFIMVKFIQTSDWQIGMKGGGLGEAGPIVRDIRIKSINNVLQAAQEKNVDFVLICGDTFEHNMISQEEVKKVISILNKFPNIPIYVLPGNHDILGPDCIYDRPIFKDVENLNIFHSNEPIKINDAILHPCPINSKFIIQNLTDTIPNVKDIEGIHIGVAHGSLVGKFPSSDWEDINLPIDPLCIDLTGIDYLALGHWHSLRIFEDSEGVDRIVYSGTHEQTNYNEDISGQCLLVEIEEKGDKPKINPIKTGKLTWISIEFEMKDFSSIIELKRYLSSIKEIDMVRLVLNGNLPLNSKEELDKILEFQTTLHKNFRVKLDSLNIMDPIDIHDPYDFGDPTLNQTEINLKLLLQKEKDPKKRRIIAEALTNLHRYEKEVEL